MLRLAPLLIFSCLMLTGCLSSGETGVPAEQGSPFRFIKQGKVLTAFYSGPTQQQYLFDKSPGLSFFARCAGFELRDIDNQSGPSSRSRWSDGRITFLFERSIDKSRFCRMQIGFDKSRVVFVSFPPND